MAVHPETQDLLKYATDPDNFKPDKGSTWNHTIEEDGWTKAHDSLRGEIDGFQAALAATSTRLAGKAPSSWEVAAMQRWWKSHKAHIHAHHTNEDETYVPFFNTRFQYPEKLEADHVELVKQLDVLDELVGGLSTTDTSCVQKLAEKWDAYKTLLYPHLLEEERNVLPLMMAYFTQAEFGKIVQGILMSPEAPPEEMGAFIHYMGVDTFYNKFMKQEGIPFFVWWLGGFGKKLSYYEAEVSSQLDALESGTPPPPPPAKGFLGCCRPRALTSAR